MTQIHSSVSRADNGQCFITAFLNGQLKQVDDTNPNFQSILDAIAADTRGEVIDEQEFADLFDIPKAIARKFQRLSDRVTVDDTGLYFDGDPVEEGLTKHLFAMLDEGEDVAPLVNFLEFIEQNQSENSRKQAWEWLNYNDFTITESGTVIAYKGVYSDRNGGYRSSHKGHAFRTPKDGERYEIDYGYVPNAVGDLIEMPRSEVADDPNVACHVGLHVGTFSFASGWASGAMLKVEVNPRDIVSVPNGHDGEKIRVSRYRVLEIINEPVRTSVDHSVVRIEATYTENENPDVTFYGFNVGDKVRDEDGDEGKIVAIGEDDDITVEYEDFEDIDWRPEELTRLTTSDDTDVTLEVKTTGYPQLDENGFRSEDPADYVGVAKTLNDQGVDTTPEDEAHRAKLGNILRGSHGKGGPTSQAAKGRGMNPAQDPKTGRFAAGRPGSTRDRSTGRFS